MGKKPKNCKGHYIPWICGTCGLKQECKPSELAKHARKVRA